MPVGHAATIATTLLLCLSCGGENTRTALTPEFGRRHDVALARGPLRVLQKNPRYFTSGSGNAILLVGSHTWDNRQDVGARPFDWVDYLKRLRQYNHNFVKLWVWEQPKGLTTWPDPTDPDSTLIPELFARRGPGLAADGGLQFDLTAFNDAHFKRLRHRVVSAGQEGIYVSIMLFNGWSVEQKAGGSNPWTFHPFNRSNNVSGVDGDPNRDQRGTETHTLQAPSITRIQEAYVRRVVDTVNDLDNVLYEVSNESNADSREWQYHIVNYIKSYESTKAKQHPVGMSAFGLTLGQEETRDADAFNAALFLSPADWVSPIGGGTASGDYSVDPPAATGRRVVLVDTDHLWGIGGSSGWAWKSLTRGLNVIYMDPWDGRVVPANVNPDLRRNLGYMLFYAARMRLADMVPHPELASTGYCLAHPGSEYLIYVPGTDEWLRPRRVLGRVASSFFSGRADVDLSAARRELSVEWLSPRTGEIIRAGTVSGGRQMRFEAPFAGAAVLYLASADSSSSNPPPE